MIHLAQTNPGELVAPYPFRRVRHADLQGQIQDATECARLMGRTALVIQFCERSMTPGELVTYSDAARWHASDDITRRLATVDPDGLVRYEAVRA
jgi:hypothetical protein